MTDKTDMPEGITRDDTVHGETYFTAADMATASAQGFRDGVASLAASAGSEPVAWRIDWPDEPYLGHYFSEAPTDSGRCQPLYTHPSPPEGAGWINLPGTPPEPGTPVLLDIGKKYPIRAMWAAKHTVEAHDEASPEWVDYDDVTDAVYCPEGWYEWNENEEVHWAVNAKPRAWMALPLPAPPASEAKEA